MLRLAFDFIITWRETRTRPNAYLHRQNSAYMHVWRTLFHFMDRIPEES